MPKIQDRPLISQAEWEWFGHAGHFICGQWCRFHLCTKVGKYLISTVGEYVPDEGVREILARTRGITLTGRGDDRLRDYMNKIGFEPLGAGTETYETMVFLAGPPCQAKDCNCGMPSLLDCSEIMMERYGNAGEARVGHLKYCDLAAGDAITTWEERDADVVN